MGHLKLPTTSTENPKIFISRALTLDQEIWLATDASSVSVMAKYDKPTKKGISLTLVRWKNLVDQLESADRTLENKQSFWNHIGGNVYCNVTDNSVYVDIRQYWKPEQEIVPTRKGICLRPKEYSGLKELVPEIKKLLPELDTVVPCYLQSDHMNQLGVLQCPECNPNDCGNW